MNPDAMVIIPAGRSAKSSPSFASVGSFPGNHISRKCNVGIGRVGFDFGKVAPAPPQSWIFIYILPAFSCIITPINSAIIAGIYGCI